MQVFDSKAPQFKDSRQSLRELKLEGSNIYLGLESLDGRKLLNSMFKHKGL